MKTKTIDGVEHYQRGVTDEWVPTHPVPELHRGLCFYAMMYPSPIFIVESNCEDRRGRVPPSLPGGIPNKKEVGEYWLLYNPSSSSEPLRWRRGDKIREEFKASQYSTDPTEMVKGRGGGDNEPWWQPIVDNDMTYDFIDSDLPEKRAEEQCSNNSSSTTVNNNSNINSDNPAADSSIVSKVKSYLAGFF